MNIYKQRIHAARLKIGQQGSALLVTNARNIYYLTGFRGISPEEREASLLVTLENAYLFVPRMYAEQGELLASVQAKTVTLVIDDERDGLLYLPSKYLRNSDAVLLEEQNLRLFEFDAIQSHYSATILRSGSIIESLRIIKDKVEVEIIKRAVEIADLAWRDLVACLRTDKYEKRSEYEIAEILLSLSRKHGGEGWGFDPIVASGAGSSQPHYKTGSKKLESNTVLLVDFGVSFQGYTSDLTRTVMLGAVSDEILHAYQTVLACNQSAIQECRPGVLTSDLQEHAVDFFKSKQVDQYFIHGLGHGVGLDIHEEPYFRQTQDTKLEPGMIVTIEPGLYYPNQFGIRIEDYLLITEDGAEVLSSSPKEPVIL
jgi:Xaa-Pro aminopeptidase